MGIRPIPSPNTSSPTPTWTERGSTGGGANWRQPTTTAGNWALCGTGSGCARGEQGPEGGARATWRGRLRWPRAPSPSRRAATSETTRTTRAARLDTRMQLAPTMTTISLVMVPLRLRQGTLLESPTIYPTPPPRRRPRRLRRRRPRRRRHRRRLHRRHLHRRRLRRRRLHRHLLHRHRFHRHLRPHHQYHQQHHHFSGGRTPLAPGGPCAGGAAGLCNIFVRT